MNWSWRQKRARSRPRCIWVTENVTRTDAGSGRGDRFVTELSQQVIAALEDLARDRQARSIRSQPLSRLGVVLIVGAALARGAHRRFKTPPPQRGWALAAEMPRGASLVGLVHGDVQPGEPDRVARGGEPAGGAALGQDRDRGQLSDAELPQQRLAARLVARERAQASV